LEQVGAGGHPSVMGPEPGSERFQQGQPRVGSFRHRHRDCPVEGDHRIPREALQQLVERRYLRPVGVAVCGGSRVHGGDHCLQLILPDRSTRERFVQHCGAFCDERTVPSLSVLFGQGDQRSTLGGPRRSPGVGEEHEGKESGHLGIVGQPSHQCATEPDRFAGKVGAM